MLPQSAMRPARLTETQPLCNKENEDPNANNKSLVAAKRWCHPARGVPSISPVPGNRKANEMDKT